MSEWQKLVKQQAGVAPTSQWSQLKQQLQARTFNQEPFGGEEESQYQDWKNRLLRVTGLQPELLDKTYDLRGLYKSDKEATFDRATGRYSLPPEFSRAEGLTDEERTVLEGVSAMQKGWPGIELLGSAVTSAAAVPVSGLVGAGVTALKGPEAGADIMRKMQEELIYRPQTAEGQKLANLAAYPFQKLSEQADRAGQATLEATGSPLAATAVATAIEGAPDIAGAIASLRSPKPNSIGFDRAVERGISKGIKPSFTKRKTPWQRTKYSSASSEVVKDIVDNLDQIELLDPETGSFVRGKLPETVDDFAQAIAQRKSNIYQIYDQMKKEASGQGASLKLQGLEKELDSIINAPGLQDLFKETVNYAKQVKQDLVRKTTLEPVDTGVLDSRGQNVIRMEPKTTGRGEYTLADAQKTLENLNDSLKAFEANPSPQNYGRALVDRTVADYLRTQLDKEISNYSGPGYQELRKMYSDYKKVELDVNRRANQLAGRANYGIFDLSNVFTGYHVIESLINTNPSKLVAGVGSRLISEKYKAKTDPNLIIGDMFERAQRFAQPQRGLTQKLGVRGAITGSSMYEGRREWPE